MLNPFIQSPHSHKTRKVRDETEESFAQMYGRSVDSASPRPSMGLFFGKLLIRMGEKLVKENVPLKSRREHA
jgi:hypothetical protein